MNEDVRTFVIGGNHHNTLGVIRALGQKGVPLILLLVDDNRSKGWYVSKSRYVSKKYVFSTYEKAVDFLIENKIESECKDIIICCSDGASSAVDCKLGELSKHYICPNAKTQGNITRLMSKEGMANEAQQVGLLVPKSWIIESNEVSSQIEYPCIIKPLYSIKGSKNDIHVFQNQDSLKKYLTETPHSQALQAQKFIVKEFEYQLIGCSLNGGEHIVIPGVSHVIRPSDTTNTGFLKYGTFDDSYATLDKTKAFIKRIGYSGLFSVEFLRGMDGNDYFMEINFRNDGNAICVTAAGVNLPYIWYLNAIGHDFKSEIKEIKSVYVMPEFDDMAQMFHGKVSFWNWLRDIHRTDCFMEFDKNDKKPFFYRVGDMFMVAFRKIAH